MNKEKYQEALNNVKRVYVESDHYDEEDINLLQELVDKATPKKRVYIDTTPSISSHFICPVCKTKVSPIGLYCDNCGQALDWSDEDD
jgi:hypothetical protein